jgi:hypothetical protein
VIGIAVLGAIVAHTSTLAPTATAVQHVQAATNGVAAAYWTGAGTMLAMAVLGLVFIRRRA